MRYGIGFCALMASVLLGACAGSEPKCSSRETQDVLQQILDEKLAPLRIGYPANGEITWRVINIVTDEQAPTQAACSGDVAFSVRNKDTGQTSGYNKRLSWSAQRTDDGRIYVTAHGL